MHTIKFLTAVTMKSTAFWNVLPLYNPIEVHQLKGTYSSSQKMETEYSSEMSVHFY
jgi:hypothetical protein